jgi:2-polyprenyl-3-methyl-5-hydroxy-6-metoxy-1,4-benzoquinol methylase
MSVPPIARLYASHWDQGYVKSKLKSDPLYHALQQEIGSSPLPLLDLGCGLGISAFYLRASGMEFPITGLDYDLRKIKAANRAVQLADYQQLRFLHHDAREGLPEHHGNVCILDILQFFNPIEQATLLTQAAARVAPGGKLIIRSGIIDASWRFKVTLAGDWLAKATFWMKAAPIHYPTAQDFETILSPFGSVQISPLWGQTPFNNHLIVMQKPPATREW